MCYWLLRVWLVLHVFVLSSLHCLSVHFDVQKVVNGAKVVNWICVNFCPNLSEPDAQQFCQKLSDTCRNTGLVIFLIILWLCSDPKGIDILSLFTFIFRTSKMQILKYSLLVLIKLKKYSVAYVCMSWRHTRLTSYLLCCQIKMAAYMVTLLITNLSLLLIWLLHFSCLI